MCGRLWSFFFSLLLVEFFIKRCEEKEKKRKEKRKMSGTPPAPGGSLARALLDLTRHQANRIPRDWVVGDRSAAFQRLTFCRFSSLLGAALGQPTANPLKPAPTFEVATPRPWNPRADLRLGRKTASLNRMVATHKADGVCALFFFADGVALLREPRAASYAFTQVTDAELVASLGAAGVQEVVLHGELCRVRGGVTLPPHGGHEEGEGGDLDTLFLAFDVFHLKFDSSVGLARAGPTRSARATRQLRVQDPGAYVYDRPLEERLRLCDAVCDLAAEALGRSKMPSNFAATRFHLVAKPRVPLEQNASSSVVEQAFASTWHVLPGSSAKFALEPAVDYLRRWDAWASGGAGGQAASRESFDLPQFVFKVPVPRGPHRFLWVHQDGTVFRALDATGRVRSGQVPPAHRDLFDGRRDPAATVTAETKLKFTSLVSVDLLVTARGDGWLQLASNNRGNKEGLSEQFDEGRFSLLTSPPRLAGLARVGTVVECVWDPHASTWRPIALRRDKDRPNHSRVVRETRETVVEMLRTGFLHFGAPEEEADVVMEEEPGPTPPALGPRRAASSHSGVGDMSHSDLSKLLGNVLGGNSDLSKLLSQS
jgi:hypothetical protein